MSNTQTLTVNNQNSPISNLDERVKMEAIYSSNRHNTEKFSQTFVNNTDQMTNWTERLKNYFIANDGRITLAEFFFTLSSVIIQHIMGTCHHSISDGMKVIKWYIFTPPFGAGPHTAVFFFVLSWITLFYCIERIWTYFTLNVRTSKKRDLIVHGIIVVLYLLAFSFNIWGYILCESASQVSTSQTFAPGVCRGDSQACIPLIAGVLISFATACGFFTEHILALMNLLSSRQESNSSTSRRILL